MQEIIQTITEILPHTDAVILSLATGAGAMLAVAVKMIFSLLGGFTKKTATEIDDKMIEGTKQSFKDKIKDI